MSLNPGNNHNRNKILLFLCFYLILMFVLSHLAPLKTLLFNFVCSPGSPSLHFHARCMSFSFTSIKIHAFLAQMPTEMEVPLLVFEPVSFRQISSESGTTAMICFVPTVRACTPVHQNELKADSIVDSASQSL